MVVKVAAFAIRFFCASHSASTLAWACMIGGYRYQSISMIRSSVLLSTSDRSTEAGNPNPGHVPKIPSLSNIGLKHR